MPSFSDKSQAKLDTCHPDLQRVFNEVIKEFDCTIIEGVRTVERQEELVRTGMSQTMNSKHLKQDDGYSHAVDAAPYYANKTPKVDWNNRDAFVLFAGYVLGIADQLYRDGQISYRVVSGIDWDRDFDTSDHNFFDGPHFQLQE